MAIDCETCQPVLLDLAYGELNPALALEARAHMEGCASCRADLERLARGIELARSLPVLEVPEGVSELLLARAAQHAETQRQAHSPARRSAWQALLDFIGQFAMTPQVGMATISLLIVAVGIWSVPRLNREPEAAGVAVVNPDPEGQAGPSLPLQPAERLDLAVDSRGKRIRSREEAAELARRVPPAPSASAGAASGSAPSVDVAVADADDEYTLAQNTMKGLPQALAPGDNAGLDDREGASAKAENAVAATSPVKQARASKSKSALVEGDVFAEGERSAAMDNAGAAPYPSAAAEEARFAEAPPAAAPAPLSGGQSSAVGAARAAAPKPVPEPKTKAESEATDDKASAVDSLARARELHAAGGCRSAITGYEQLIQAFPASREAGEAMLALASCYQGLGQRAQAKLLLERAAQRAATAERARAMLKAIAAASAETEGGTRK